MFTDPPLPLAWQFDWLSNLSYAWWGLSLLLMFVGLIGTLIPLLPGSTIILCGAVLHHFTVPQQTVGWWSIVGLTVLTIVSYGVDFASGTVGAKWFGATKWGAIGGIIGAIVGLFLGVVGVLVAPLVGVLIGELIGGKGLAPATKSTWGTVIGTGAGILANFVIGLIMIGWFFVAALH